MYIYLYLKYSLWIYFSGSDEVLMRSRVWSCDPEQWTHERESVTDILVHKDFLCVKKRKKQ